MTKFSKSVFFTEYINSSIWSIQKNLIYIYNIYIFHIFYVALNINVIIEFLFLLIGRTDVEGETPILWPPDAKS